MPGIRSVFIGFPAAGQTDPAFDGYTIVDLRHVIRLKPLDAQPAAGDGTVS